MNTGFSKSCKPKFRILDDAQIARIHDAVLRILDEVGVRVNHPEVLDLLAGHGAREILDTHQPEPLAAEIKNELDRIWQDVKKVKEINCGDFRRCL